MAQQQDTSGRIEKGASRQCEHDVSWITDVLTVSEHGHTRLGRLTGKPPNTREVTNTRKLEMAYFKQMQVYRRRVKADTKFWECDGWTSRKRT